MSTTHKPGENQSQDQGASNLPVTNSATESTNATNPTHPYVIPPMDKKLIIEKMKQFKQQQEEAAAARNCDEDEGEPGKTPATDPDWEKRLNKKAKQLRVTTYDLHLQAINHQYLGNFGEPLLYSAMIDQVLREYGDSSNPVVKMLLEQITFLHQLIPVQVRKANDAQSVEISKTHMNAALKMMEAQRKAIAQLEQLSKHSPLLNMNTVPANADAQSEEKPSVNTSTSAPTTFRPDPRRSVPKVA